MLSPVREDPRAAKAREFYGSPTCWRNGAMYDLQPQATIFV